MLWEFLGCKEGDMLGFKNKKHKQSTPHLDTCELLANNGYAQVAGQLGGVNHSSEI